MCATSAAMAAKLKIVTSKLARWHVSMQGTLVREYISTQGTLAPKHVSMQGTLVHEHVSTQDTLACEHISTLARKHARHARHVDTWAHKHVRHVGMFLACRACNLGDSFIIDLFDSEVRKNKKMTKRHSFKTARRVLT